MFEGVYGNDHGVSTLDHNDPNKPPPWADQGRPTSKRAGNKRSIRGFEDGGGLIDCKLEGMTNPKKTIERSVLLVKAQEKQHFQTVHGVLLGVLLPVLHAAYSTGRRR